MPNRRIWLSLVRGALLSLGMGMLLIAPAVVHAGIVAVCADGSIVLAKKWIDVHCAGAVEVAPENVPPIGSGIRPRSIAWANFLREQEATQRASQNGLVGGAHVSNRPSVQPAAHRGSSNHTPADRRRYTLTGDVSSLASLITEQSLPLTSDEHRDLALFVDLSQGDTPAIVEHTHAGETMAVLKIAHSLAFEAQLRARRRAAGNPASGPVLVFSLEPANAALTTTHLSFAQRGPSFLPSAGDPREFSWIHDGEARTRLGNGRLGYIVLPASFDVSRPMVVFWDDSVVATTLRR